MPTLPDRRLDATPQPPMPVHDRALENHGQICQLGAKLKRIFNTMSGSGQIATDEDKMCVPPLTHIGEYQAKALEEASIIADAIHNSLFGEPDMEKQPR